MRPRLVLRLLWAPSIMLLVSGTAPAEETAKPERSASTKADAQTPDLNGFSLEKTVVPRESIRGGGPARDRIRSVDAPEFVPPQDAPWCPPAAPVIGLAVAGVAHAYPVHLMEYHQVVNDEIGGKAVALTFDPLTAVPRAWERRVGDRVLEFGVSGLLHDGQFLLYDRQTESLWAQYTGRAVAGPLAGQQLEGIQVHQEPLGIWFQREPGTLVMTRPEPRKIDYRYSPYEVYWVTDDVPFEVKARDDRYHPKEVVLGLSVDGKQRAYLGSILTAEGGRIVDDFAGRKVRVAYDSETATFQWQVPDDVAVTDAYWFAWKSFHPDTEIWNDGKGAREEGAPERGAQDPEREGSANAEDGAPE